MTTALLLMDFQNGIAGRPGFEPTVEAAARALTAARDHGIPPVFVRVAFRPGYPEVAASNLAFGGRAAAAGDAMLVDRPGTQIIDDLAPRGEEPVVVKKRVSAFAGSDLDVLLRGLRADELVLTGIATGGVVLSTIRQAADLDFRLTVLSDACGDPDPEVHRVLTEKIFPRQAAVTTVDEWAAAL
ncbi:cysteine hydrolase family protein [Leifsonia sp. 21MFCrub1.1]|uniref:cysteine hydrolase family protein n=1 Tax=Leifsonia sp. 21MFCrub1.1 TaxID=1798223 RepID=UPI00089298E4|nr:isochorismatase family cysteine hydrolase [Leifsonia sp. 21MFCrub1.1]SEA37181.1 Nicotinamidase-related amidase [Leifsonia sp. 21MFCrub1.1]